MVMGKAIVATPTDGTREVIVNEQNGLVIPFEKPKGLAEAIIRLHDDFSLYEQCGQHARMVLAERFNAQRESDAVATIYHACL